MEGGLLHAHRHYLQYWMLWIGFVDHEELHLLSCMILGI